MALTLNKRVWVLLERLYITIYSADEFIEYLKSFDIKYTGEIYKTFRFSKGLYTFMSEENYEFADFMSLVPTYKYIEILKPIVFDSKIQKTQRDNWNYYGEYIKYWYPDLIDLLKLAGIQIDYENELLILPEETKQLETDDFLQVAFGDIFLDYIKKEINEAYKNGLYLSVMFLSRKIIESVIIRTFEVVFPKIVDKQYSEDNHNLWYDKNRGTHRNLETLLDNLKYKAPDFHEDKDLILEVLSLIKPFKNETNMYVHNDYKIPDESYLKPWKIPYIIGLTHKIFRKYCNP